MGLSNELWELDLLTVQAMCGYKLLFWGWEHGKFSFIVEVTIHIGWKKI